MIQEKIAEVFIPVDDFCKEFQEVLKRSMLEDPAGKKTRDRKTGLCESEVITLLIAFHGGQFRNFKHFYLNYACVHLRDDFPGLVSYNRFIELSHRSGAALLFFLHHCRKGECTGINFIDSTVLRVCHNKRSKRNKVFKGVARTSKSSMGWFFGFKLHLVINDKGEVLAYYLTPGNVDDRNTKVVAQMTREIFGKLIGDKGYLSKALSELLFADGIQLITPVRKNMKTKALSNEERILLRKRSVIETVNDELKNVCQIEHTRHRSINGFLLNLAAGIAAYSFLPKKPSIRPHVEETDPRLIHASNSQLLLAA